MDKGKVIAKLIDGAFALARKKERDPEVAKEWAQEGLLQATMRFDRYSHLPEDQVVKILGRCISNRINTLQKREVLQDRTIMRMPDDFPATSKFDSPLGIALSRELLAVLLTKLDSRERIFVQEKLKPSQQTLDEMELDGLDPRSQSPLDRHVLPNESKATISRIKGRVREWIQRLSVLSIQELSNLDRPRSRPNQQPEPQERMSDGESELPSPTLPQAYPSPA